MLLQKEYGGNINHPRIALDHAATLASIYERAIENFLKTGGH
jgi:hypothetical protein